LDDYSACRSAATDVETIIRTAASRPSLPIMFFFFTAPATTEIYTLSLHDALPILASESIRVAGDEIDQALMSFCKKEYSLALGEDRKSTRLNSSHVKISYAVFCLKKKKKKLARPINSSTMNQPKSNNAVSLPLTQI